MNEFHWFYWFCRGFMRICYQLFWRLHVEGQSNIPTSGSVIIAANHRSFADPPLVGSAMKRDVHFLAKKQLFSFKPFGLLISNLNAHPLDRSSSTGAIRLALRLLEEGHAVIVFPEGTRQKSDVLGPAKAGVGLLGKLSKAPIVPTYIHNSGRIWSFKPLSVTFGAPINPIGFTDQQEMANQVMQAIQKIKDEKLKNQG